MDVVCGDILHIITFNRKKLGICLGEGVHGYLPMESRFQVSRDKVQFIRPFTASGSTALTIFYIERSDRMGVHKIKFKVKRWDKTIRHEPFTRWPRH